MCQQFLSVLFEASNSYLCMFFFFFFFFFFVLFCFVLFFVDFFSC